MKNGKSNQVGGALQTRLESILTGYRRAGIADIEKVDPPVRVVGTGRYRRIIFQHNPWLDYAGTWTRAHGRTVMLEAKATDRHLLPLARDGGLTANQFAAMLRWSSAGVAVAVVWEHEGGLKVVTAGEVAAAHRAGQKSLRWADYPAAPRGTGLIEFDLLGDIACRMSSPAGRPAGRPAGQPGQY